MSMTRPVLLLALFFMVLVVPAKAQELRIGVVTPLADTQAAAAADAFARRLNLSSSPVLRDVEVLIRQTSGGADAALAAAQELIRQEAVHALVCCTDHAASAAVAHLAQSELVLILSPNAWPEDLEGIRMAVTLTPSTLTVFRAITLAAREHGSGIGMLVRDGPMAAEIGEALRDGALEAGITVTRVEQFPAGSAPLTPEALLVATSLPSSVVVWAGEADSRNAVDALRARGYDGPVWLNHSEAAALAEGFPTSQLQFVVPPVLLAAATALDTGNYAAVSAFRAATGGGLSGSGLSAGGSLNGALVHDALSLVISAFEQALAYGVSPQSTSQFRQAVADGLISAGTVPLAAGTYRWNGEANTMALPAGLYGAAGRGGRFVALR